MGATITILGCGNSTGVPAIGNYWGKCNPQEPKNIRLRSSMLLQSASSTIVIDTGPDFREQLNKGNISNIDAVFLTHPHGDHISGMDDLRVLALKAKTKIPFYASTLTMPDILPRYEHLFYGTNNQIYIPVLQAEEFQNGDVIKYNDLEIQTFNQDHGTCVSTGYRFGNYAYSLDFINLDDNAIEILKGVDVWVVDCAGYDVTSPVHADFDKIHMLNQKIGAKTVYLSSLSVSADYQTLCQELPGGYFPAYDGLKIEIDL